MPNSDGVKIILSPTAQQLKSEHSQKIKDIKDLKTVYSKVSIFLDRWVQLNFRSEGGKVGGWAKLKSGGRYVGKGRNRRFDSSAKVLQDTGRLRASFLPFASKKNAGVGSELPYSKTHEKGKGVTKRKILPENKDVWPKAKKIINAHVKKSLNK